MDSITDKIGKRGGGERDKHYKERERETNITQTRETERMRVWKRQWAQGTMYLGDNGSEGQQTWGTTDNGNGGQRAWGTTGLGDNGPERVDPTGLTVINYHGFGFH